MLACVAGDARAAEPSAGGPVLKQARAAWDRGSLEAAEALYRDALEKGGLASNEVVEGYVRLGSIRAVRGKKDSALAAFRAASILDATFAIPKEAGAKGARIAEKAKRDTAKIGSIQLGLQVPKDVSAGKPFKVVATLDKNHLPIANKIVVVAKDGTTGKDVTFDAKPEESVDFEVGSELTLPGANIVVRVDALDSHQNHLATAEDRVRVPDSPGGPAVATGPAITKPATPAREASAPLATTVNQPPGADTAGRHSGSFWTSPWPYIIGGVALAGAGAAVYFGTRPSENVSVGEVGVRAQ